MVTATLITAAELERMPDGEHFELVNGVLREMAPPGGEHGYLQIELGAELRQFVKQHGLGRVYGEVGFVIMQNPDTVLAPDVAFVRAGRVLPKVRQSTLLRQIPDLAVEIVSPSDRVRQVIDKVNTYLHAGVPMIWTVEPKRRRVLVWDEHDLIQVFGPGQTLDGGDLLPGFQLQIDDLFDDGELVVE